jgi:hypothetical protein
LLAFRIPLIILPRGLKITVSPGKQEKHFVRWERSPQTVAGFITILATKGQIWIFYFNFLPPFAHQILWSVDRLKHRLDYLFPREQAF